MSTICQRCGCNTEGDRCEICDARSSITVLVSEDGILRPAFFELLATSKVPIVVTKFNYNDGKALLSYIPQRVSNAIHTDKG